jgi:hypothetical protein
MEANGYAVKAVDVVDVPGLKKQHGVPPELQSCHTAIVDGYVIEGHVPVSAIEELLAERPLIVGLAVPGMPVGSPGMEVEGADPQPYDVLAFDAQGNTEVFASFNQ